MPLNTAADLSLGKLGHISGGNAGTTGADTRLGNTCRGGTGTQTKMWDDFKIGSISFNQVSRVQGGGSIDDGYVIISVPHNKDVGDYMGSSSGGSDYYVSNYYSDLRSTDVLVCQISESSSGSLYVSRIQNRSSNSADYVFSTTGTSQTINGHQEFTEQDKFTTEAPD